MLYHKFMAYRVKSRTRIRGMKYRKQHPVLSLTTLSSLGLCATAIYASLGVWDNTAGKWAGRESGGVSWEFAAEIPPDRDPAFRRAEREASVDPISAVESEEWRNWPVSADLLRPWESSQLDGISSLQEEFERRDREEKYQRHNGADVQRGVAVHAAVVEIEEIPLVSAEVEVATADTGARERSVDSSVDNSQSGPGVSSPATSASEISSQDRSQAVGGGEEGHAPSEGLAQSGDRNNDDAVVDNSETYRWVSAKVREGDSLSLLFSRLGLSAGLLHDIVNSGEEAKKLASVRPGEMLRVKLDEGGDFEQLVLERNALNSLQVAKVSGKFEASLVSQPVEVRNARVAGVITDSLYMSAKRVGMTDKLIMELAGIFGWDVDFALDIKQGDSFAVIYEERFINGERYKDGHILAAEFVNGGKVFRAVRFESEEGYASYYTPDGHSMRKAFLRAPVDFRRISSRFNPERYHPVLGKKRPHRGVDYAASTGTPIRAAGDGRVAFRGVKGGYGNTIIIKHGERYTTLYAHLSKFSASVNNGARVEQGDIIGYVGATGLATGPHLHYEFRLDGVHRDPLTVDLPKALPIEKRYRVEFLAQSAPLVAELGKISSTRLASKD